ncbi:DUF1501 domain-containing protein [Planctomicrobium sp.]|jgi:hypothetical protein|nr:DUF1501 domain-containing protein [Planctomicrobium sp.]MDB4732827.1 DUF1501 domain-containing protein [Planctomicrobium sp.]
MAKLNRRKLIQLGALGATGLSFSNYSQLFSAEPDTTDQSTADAVMFINLAGGVSHLDTLDMKPESPVDTHGEFKRIQSCIAGLQVCEHLPKLAGSIDQFTLIRGISHSAGAHPQGQSWISTGNRPSPAVVYPAMGSVVTKEFPGAADLPENVAIPKTEWNPGYLGDAYAAFKTNTVPQPGKTYEVRGLSLREDVTLQVANRRESLLRKVNRTFRDTPSGSPLIEAMDKFGQQAHQMITSPKAQLAFAVDKEPESIRKRFTSDSLNQSCMLACRLIQHGTRFVSVTNAGWDTHLDNFIGHKRLLQPLDNALLATISTLKDKGILDRTLVVIMGEFGRTPNINANAGRDHFPRVNWCLMAGGGVATSRLVGSTNKNGDAPSDDTQISPDDITATIYHTLGIPAHKEYITPSGRPVTLVPEGRVLNEVFA